MATRTTMPLSPLLCVGLLLGCFAAPCWATWSIVLADRRTKEVAVGMATCRLGDLLGRGAVVLTGQGAAAVQSLGDRDGMRRRIIHTGFLLDLRADDLLVRLATAPGHELRQYGLVKTGGDATSFTGARSFPYAGGRSGLQGDLVYAIQGNFLTGASVLAAVEAALQRTASDLPGKLMAAMQAARSMGGDGRCSCSPTAPTSCGSPPARFSRSAMVGGMIVARSGDQDDVVCDAGGCAEGSYFLSLHLAHQTPAPVDPVVELEGLFRKFRADHAGHPDAVQSSARFEPPYIPPNGSDRTTLLVRLKDWRGERIAVPLVSATVLHAPTSAGCSAIGPVVDNQDGTLRVSLTAGTTAGIDRFIVTVDDGRRPVVLMPNPVLEYRTGESRAPPETIEVRDN